MSVSGKPVGCDATPSPKGAILKLFAVVLIGIATMNAMLAWRGGFSLAGVPTALFLAGLALYAMGAARSARADRARGSSSSPHPEDTP